MEQSEPAFEDIEGDVIARTHEIARWRETGEVAYERDVAVRLTLDDERIVKIVVMPGGALPSRVDTGSQADQPRGGRSSTTVNVLPPRSSNRPLFRRRTPDITTLWSARVRTFHGAGPTGCRWCAGRVAPLRPWLHRL